MANLLLDRYDIIQSLGSGGFGETFLARDRQMPSQRLVVVKKLKPANANQNTSTDFITQLFEKEAAVLEELGNGSTQIPKLYSYFSDNDEFYLVQEYIEGQSLSEVAPIGGEQAKTILSSLLNTLKFIHSKGIIHRDIKPENIILRDKDKLPVLIDFGAVKETMGAVQLGSGSMVSSVVIGTRGFMAPEQSAGRSVFSTDLYALGLTMIFAMTKKLPVEFATSQLTGEMDWQSDVPTVDPHLAQILDKAIKMELSRRYPTAEAMYQDLHLLSSVSTNTSSLPATIVVAPATNSNPTLVVESSQAEKNLNDNSIKVSTIFVLFILGFIAFIAYYLSNPKNREFLNESVFNQAKEEEIIPEPTPIPTPTLPPPIENRMLGKWVGTYAINDVLSTLEVTYQSGVFFQGTVKTGGKKGGSYVLGVEGEINPQTNQIEWREVKIISTTSSKRWYLGRNTGVISSDFQFISGTGKDNYGNIYSWSLRKE
jgi:serine/threonine protein kinase